MLESKRASDQNNSGGQHKRGWLVAGRCSVFDGDVWLAWLVYNTDVLVEVLMMVVQDVDW